jgi:hypothetical protein
MITDFAPTVTFHHIFSTVPRTTWVLCRSMELIFILDKEVGIWEKTMDQPELKTLLQSFFHMMVF